MPLSQLAVNTLAALLPLALVSIGLFGQFSAIRVVSLSMIAAAAVGPYAAKIASPAGSIWPALAIAGLAGALIALAGSVVDGLFLGRSRALALLASLGFIKVVQGLLTATGGGGVEVFRVPPEGLLNLTDIVGGPPWLDTGLSLLVLVGVAQWGLLKRSKVGVAAIAIGDDQQLAALFGIPVLRVQMLIQSVGGAIVGAAGVILALESGLRPDLGFALALKAFGVLIVAGSRYWAVVPIALLLAALEQFVGYFWGGQLREAAGLVFLVVAVLVLSRRRSELQTNASQG